MSFEEIKEQIQNLDAADRKRLQQFLAVQAAGDDPEFWSTINARIEDKNPESWLTPEQLRERLSNEG